MLVSMSPGYYVVQVHITSVYHDFWFFSLILITDYHWLQCVSWFLAVACRYSSLWIQDMLAEQSCRTTWRHFSGTRQRPVFFCSSHICRATPKTTHSNIKIIFIGSKHPNTNWFNFENKITVSDAFTKRTNWTKQGRCLSSCVCISTITSLNHNVRHDGQFMEVMQFN